MRSQVIQQPNGLLAMFDPRSQNWAIWDATPEELIEFYKDEAARKAAADMNHHILVVTKDDPHTLYGRETLSFKQANDRHLASGGNEVFDPDDFIDQGIQL
jgi:hypothetical protein